MDGVHRVRTNGGPVRRHAARIRMTGSTLLCAVVIASAVTTAAAATKAPVPASPPAASERIVAEATKGQFKQLRGRYHDKECGESVDYSAEVVDLNADGQPEVFIIREGSCLGGRAGSHVDLFIKGKDGKWASQLGFPGGYKILATKNQGFPDIEIVGPGTCFPVWRWNGSSYAVFKRCR